MTTNYDPSVVTPLDVTRRFNKAAKEFEASMLAHPAGGHKKMAAVAQSAKISPATTATSPAPDTSSAHAQIKAHLAVIEAQLEAVAIQLETPEHEQVLSNTLMSDAARHSNEALRHIAAAITDLHRSK
ncbi:hypothetical protein AB0O14_17750 [Microbacterium foliorum]|uniref:hypothetical protein n=1 Tax=Rothia terrae TaxID=396015 RepID=UPI003441FD8B